VRRLRRTNTRRGVTFRVAAVTGIDASESGNIGVWIDVTPGRPSRIHVLDVDTPWIMLRARGRRVALAPGFCFCSRNSHTCPRCDRGMRRPSVWVLVRHGPLTSHPSTRARLELVERLRLLRAGLSLLTPPNSPLAGESRPWRLCLQRVWQTLSGRRPAVEKCRNELGPLLLGEGIRRLWLRPLVP
jgi:hypothetical protein